MQNFSVARKVLLLFFVAAVVAIGALVYAYYHNKSGIPPPGSSASPAAAGIVCMQSPEYFVVDIGPEGPGLDVIAKHKTSANEAFPCTDAVAKGDVVVQNDLPEFVLGVAEHFLVIDSGTAPPPRGLIIYDLDTQTSTFSDTYSPPIDIATGTVTYWEVTSQAPTARNCPALAQYSSDGLGAVIESRVTLELATMKAVPLGASQCAPTQ